MLYLDQFFYSHTFRGSDKRFIAASERIKELTARQLIVAPYSKVHEDETHQWERYSELLEFVKQTSRGHEFAPAYDVERVQLERAFDAWLQEKSIQYTCDESDVFHENIHVWESYFRIDVGKYLGDRELIRSLKKESIQGLVDLFADWRQSENSFEEDLLLEQIAAAQEYWSSYGVYASRMVQGDFSALIDSPIVSQIVQTLLRHLPEATPEDQRPKMVAEFLVSDHFRQTPYNDLSARIYACLKATVKEGAYKNTKKALNRLSGFFFDVKHIATYAPYCDAFVVDKPMAELLARPEVSISDRYGVKIFSLQNWDDFTSWFDAVEEAETLEHKQALANAYFV